MLGDVWFVLLANKMSGKGKWTLRSGVRGDGAADIKTQCTLKYLYCVCGMLMWRLASTQAATLGQAPQLFRELLSLNVVFTLVVFHFLQGTLWPFSP